MQFTPDIFLYLFLAYFIGSIPSAVWISKIFYKRDIRDFGSGNSGATNTIRILGWKAGLPVLVLDISKGFSVTLFTYLLDQSIYSDAQIITLKLLFGLFALVGHIFPVMAGFRGGKGIATMFGLMLGIHPVVSLFVLILFIIIVSLTRYVSLGSILAAISFPILFYYLESTAGFFHYVISIMIPVIVVLTHRQNIKRLAGGNENKLRVKKKIESR